LIAELGHFALALAMILAFAQMVLTLWGAETRNARLMAAGPPLATGGCIAIAASFACLMYSYAINDTSVLNVVQNSHSAKPMLFKITGTWGNHEGSLILWVMILALCGLAVAAFGRDLPSTLKARVHRHPRAGQPGLPAVHPEDVEPVRARLAAARRWPGAEPDPAGHRAGDASAAALPRLCRLRR
jgi:hypothetical protein